MAVKQDCQCCDAKDYRDCDCPWHRPFEQWPTAKLARLKRGLNTQPTAGS